MSSNERAPGRYRVGSLDKGLAILRVIREVDGPMRNREIVARTGLPKATVSRLMNTLSARGYLRRIDRQGTYVLGEASTRAGRAMLGALRLERHGPLFADVFRQNGAAWLEACIGGDMVPVFRWSPRGGGALLTSSVAHDTAGTAMTSACLEFFSRGPADGPAMAPGLQGAIAAQLFATKWCFEWPESAGRLRACTGLHLEGVGVFVLAIELPQPDAPDAQRLDRLGRQLLGAASAITACGDLRQTNGDADGQAPA